MLERLNEEIRRRTYVVRILPRANAIEPAGDHLPDKGISISLQSAETGE